jgi:hypothetical protein
MARFIGVSKLNGLSLSEAPDPGAIIPFTIEEVSRQILPLNVSRYAGLRLITEWHKRTGIGVLSGGSAVVVVTGPWHQTQVQRRSPGFGGGFG